MMQMSSVLRGAGAGGGIPGTSPFPAPGVPSGATATGATSPASPSATMQPGITGTGTNVGAGAGLPSPALLQALLGAGPFGAGLGGGGLGGGSLGGFGGGLSPFGVPPAAPVDTRPPEERFQVQLQVRPISHVSYFPSPSHHPFHSPATTRDGFHQRSSKRACPSSDWR